MGIDAIVIRHRSSGVPKQITEWTDANVINAGDGWHQHPTQGLLDSYTAFKQLGPLDGKKVLICGDIIYSRVARSAISVFSKLGADVMVCGPRPYLPPNLEGWPVKLVPNIDSVLEDLDVVYMLRIQKERQDRSLIPSTREYRSLYGLTVERLKRLRSDALIMHAGPMNRGVEIDPEVADDARSVVLQQVNAGVSVRMAVLMKSLSGGLDV